MSIADRLAQQDQTFHDASAEGFENVPPGEYLVEVYKMEVRESRTHTLMLCWQFQVMDGQHSGQMIFLNSNLEHPRSVGFLKKDLAKCGLDVTNLRLSEIESWMHQLNDLSLSVKVVTGKDPKFNNVYINGPAAPVGANSGKPLAF